MSLVSSNPEHLTQRELESALWAAANALRGPVDPGDFKQYVFPILFFKWISDMHDYHHLQAQTDLGEYWTQEIEDEDYQTFTIPDDAHWDDVIVATKNIGLAINNALVSLQEANLGKLEAVFGDVNWSNKERLPENALRDLLDAFDRLTLNPERVSGDMLGAAYEYLIREFAEASGRKAGEFFTPRHVVHLLVRLLDPQPGDHIADPACGSAGMLVETVEAVKRDGGNPRSLFLYGQEQNLTTAGIARMNLYLHGLEEFTIRRGDTFREPKLLDKNGQLEQFDIVIANPPFSLKGWGADMWSTDPYGRALGGHVPPAGKGDWAWIQHMLASMKSDTGRVGVVMPLGALFRSEGGERAMREYASTRDLIDAVIALPNNLFYATSIPVCVLVFRATKPESRRGKVLFVDARERYAAGKNQNVMTDADIDGIASTFTAAADADGPGGIEARLVEHAEIADNDHDWSIGRYLATSSDEEADVDTALAAYREAVEALTQAQLALDERLKEAGFDA